MPWIKKSLIFKPNGVFEWSNTHAQVPTALILEDRIRLYYATRDKKGRSLTSFLDVDRDNPSQIIYVHDSPTMQLGEIGTFDEDGVMAGCIIKKGSDILSYYTGWSKCATIPYRVSVGLAKSTDGGITFERIFTGPIVDRTPHEPYMTMSPYVTFNNNIWKMWYGSGTKWVEIDGKMEPVYQIKYAESKDGLTWNQDNILCIKALHPLEANTRPSVILSKLGYEMWFSYRHSINFRGKSGGYRIGYATSQDGKEWYRQSDQIGLEVTEDGWTKNMVAYPNVIEIDNRRIMFFNGDGFGQAGFGYAIWESE